MAEDLLPVLARFHREVLLPDVKRVVAEAVEASERRLRDEMHTLFDSVAGELKWSGSSSGWTSWSSGPSCSS